MMVNLPQGLTYVVAGVVALFYQYTQRVYKSYNLEIYSSNKLFLSPNLAEPINLFRNQFDFIDIKLPVL